MKYQIEANSKAHQEAQLNIKDSNINFGITPSMANHLPNPAELFLGSFAACMLKNVERFSQILQFSYDQATLDVSADRIENPPQMDNIQYQLTIQSSDEKLNTALLKKNIEKHGTIYNTIKLACTISGTVDKVDHV